MTIRRQPQDFAVEEILTAECAAGIVSARTATAPLSVWRLTKTSLTTPEATARLAKALGTSGGKVSHAGLKDKHAVTTQFVTAEAPSAAGDRLSGPGWEADRTGWHPRHLQARDIAGNRFTIVVRDLSPAAAAAIRERARAIATPEGSLRFINYFGEQRFGSARHGEGFAARHLARGDFEGALRLLIATPARKDTGPRRVFTRAAANAWGQWQSLAATLPRMPERAAVEAMAAGRGLDEAFAALPNFLQQMCVDAYQSHLWNRIVGRMVRDVMGARGVFEAPGGLWFPPASGIPGSWLGVSVPMPARGVTAVAPWDAAAAAVLAEEGLGMEDLRVPGLRRPVFGDAPRPVVADARGFEMDAPCPDELGRGGRVRVTLRFDLPRGGYATVLLRALGQ
jgi:tRNA pseudouridine13 synthase